MLANYGYEDASGDYWITIDTDSCDGCGDCAGACPAGVLVMVDEDPNDPLREAPVAAVAADQKNRIKYACAPCKPTSKRPPLPCEAACGKGAISHSW